MARTRRQAPPQRLILDAGAVIGLSRAEVRARAALAAALEVGAEVSVPAVVVAETVRGGPADAPMNRVLKAVGGIDVAEESIGRNAGRLLGSAGSAATIDAIVVATAIEAGGAVILTGDADDLGTLAADNPQVIIEAL
ncbi:MAG TPA: PIN domain-containing protein [Acidimicrobiales bacterium]|nr:PIN domain-containing protein [Acidimicrobiales bacterium]